ncbi:helix-turn-helix domain-containing protein [Yokenella regensburgei]|uniref:helix-turn-helix domain-containing protein n=1 Tax=Yokenella regensburgei TaxID=158877 RepID=UPI003F185A1E
MRTQDILNAANHLVTLLPILGKTPCRQDYEDALEMVEYLLENEPASPLIDILSERIDKYENIAPEFAEFNARAANTESGLALFRVLMTQHGLNQSSFQQEIGSRSLVSKIMNGKRNLTLDHMRALAKRFNVPVGAFTE